MTAAFRLNYPLPGRRTGFSRLPHHVRHMTNGAILYSTSDEDSHTEVKGLRIRPTDSVLSVTGSGCRSLALLESGPRRLVSVDANPVQNYVLELKAAAMRQLSLSEYLCFIGFEPGQRRDRLLVFEELREHLSPPALEFWHESLMAVRRGLLYSGAHEKFYAAWIAPLIVASRRRQLRDLHNFTQVEAQSLYFESEWLTPAWERAVRMLARPRLIRILLDDPSYFERVDKGSELADYINNGLRRTFRRHLASDVDLFGLLCTGRYWDPKNVPFYMRPANYERIKSHLDALEIVTAPLGTYLAQQEEATFGAYSLSDVTGWMPHEDLVAILREVGRTAVPGARIVYRDLFAESNIVAIERETGLFHECGLSEELTEKDRARVFTIQAFQAVAQ